MAAPLRPLFYANRHDPVARLLSTVLENSASGVLNSHAHDYDLDGRRAVQYFTHER